jgi:hypothetical protein
MAALAGDGRSLPVGGPSPTFQKRHLNEPGSTITTQNDAG